MHVNEIRISHLSRWIDQLIIHFNLLAVCYWLFDITRISILRVYKRYMSIYIQSQVFARQATIHKACALSLKAGCLAQRWEKPLWHSYILYPHTTAAHCVRTTVGSGNHLAEAAGVYPMNRSKHINILWDKIQFINVTAGGLYIYH